MDDLSGSGRVRLNGQVAVVLKIICATTGKAREKIARCRAK